VIIDGHAHLDLHEIGPEDYIRAMDAAGVDKVVLLASLNGVVPSTPEWQAGILRLLLRTPLQPLGRRIYESMIRGGRLEAGGVRIEICRKPDNDAVHRAVRRYPDRFLAFVTVNPTLPDARETFERGVEEQGMVGVKCHAWWHQFGPAEELLPIARRCEEKGLPLLIHLGGSARTGNFRGLLERCPRLKLIVAHAAIPYFQAAWQAVKEHRSCFVDISGSYLSAALVRKTVQALGADKVIFGSDGPVSLRGHGGHSYSRVLGWTQDLPVSDREREKILHGNLEKLLP